MKLLEENVGEDFYGLGAHHYTIHYQNLITLIFVLNVGLLSIKRTLLRKWKYEPH